MNRSKIVAVITGAIAVLLAVAYLVLVQILDYRGEMVPAPVDLSQTLQAPLALLVETIASSLIQSVM